MITKILNTPWQTICFFGALGLYAIFSSPTPDALGLVELSIGVLLFLSLSVQHILSRPFLFLCFVTMLVWPLMMGCVAGNDMRDMGRDVVALVFLFFPLFCGHHAAANPHLFLKILSLMGGVLPCVLYLLTPLFSLRPHCGVWGHQPTCSILQIVQKLLSQVFTP